MKLLNRYRSPYDLLLPLGDATFAIFVIGALRATIYVADSSSWTYWDEWVQITAMAVVVVCAFYFTDLYAVDSARSARERLLGLMKAFGVVCLLIGVASALVPALEFER
ncbi:MAG TPA: hypothetical protein VH985_18630, partial [Candidatus Binatia bacterium]